MSDEATSILLKRAKFVVAALVVLLLLGGVTVLVNRSMQARALADATAIHSMQYVTTTQPTGGGDGMAVTLPGTLQGVIESTVYARSSGYLARWMKDIGASVKKGELLAEINAPEIDQQLHQAEAARAQSASSEALAKSSAERWQSLRQKDAVTQQELDERLSAYKQAQADLAAAEANVSRLRSLQGFNRVTAPFDGVLTRRNVDVGDLINAGNGGAGQALFSLAQVDPLRLYIYVPQVYANQVKIGDTVRVSLAEGAGEHYQGSIARTARAIDPTTRTLQVEIRVPNPGGELFSGAYVQAELPIKGDRAATVVPTNVLLFRPEGPRVAVVDQSGRVHLALVKLGTDYGNSVEVLTGLDAADRIIVNPADSLADGDVVTLVRTPQSTG
ncbi:MAG TPA: efflux RND transporter periplasmic adaptor subunit [Steroidobacteraceae bacterium]|nr:efflux RND transporter periplasmic adaptor subunit [Steroidobacteraceae bacterium]